MSWLRKVGVAVAALAGVAVVGVAGVYAASSSRLSTSYGEVTGRAVAVRVDSATIERGRHLVVHVTKCVDCHGPDLGGGLVVDDPAVGTIPASNLTTGRGGVLARYSDVLLERAVRHGVGVDGRGLWIMPSFEGAMMADDDMAAIIAYLRSVPPVDRTMPARRLGPLGRALYLAGELPLIDAARIDHAAVPPATMPVAATAEYGKYAARIGGCIGCHGEGLSGGKLPGSPPDWKPASNITPTGLKGYDEAAFFTLLRTGKRPGGTMVDSLMPVKYTKGMTDDETRAIWLYLQTVPPKEYGGR